MSVEQHTKPKGPVLLCFDGSEDAAHAISAAGALLPAGDAVVLSAWEPLEMWEPYDPGAVVSGALSRLGSRALGLDEVARELAEATAEQGTELAQTAGFAAAARAARGKAWHVICEVADELDAAVIVVGARGQSRIQSALLGSVSHAVATHARRPVLIVPA